MELEVCERPIFVLGPPRSGTSMLQWSLRQHPRLWGGPESDFLIPLIESLPSVHARGVQRGNLHWLADLNVSFDELCEYVGAGINALYTQRSGGKRWVEQTPQYTLHMREVCRLFPGAQFLFMVRDGREVVQSLRNFVHPTSHEHACKVWRDFIQAGLAFASGQSADRLLFVSYASAVSQADAELRRIYDFLGESFEPSSVSFIRDRKPINSSFDEETAARQNWREWSRQEMLEFDRIAGKLLVELGFAANRSWVDRAANAKVGPAAES